MSDKPVAIITECEACFTPDACQLHGKCFHYAAEQLRVAAPQAQEPAQPAEPVGVVGTQLGGIQYTVWDGKNARSDVSKDAPAAMLFKPLPLGTLLYAAPQAQEPLTLTDEQVWTSDEIMSINARAGLHMPVLMELVRAVLAAAQERKP